MTQTNFVPSAADLDVVLAGRRGALCCSMIIAATIGMAVPTDAVAQDGPVTDPNRPGLPTEPRPSGLPPRVDPATGRPVPTIASPTDPLDIEVQQRLRGGQSSGVPAFIPLPTGTTSENFPMTRFVDRALAAQALPGSTVRARPRPEYQAPGVQVGGFTLRPQLNAGIAYDANVYVEEDPRDDVVGYGLVGFDLLSDWGLHRASLSGFVRRRQLATFTKEDTTTYRIDGRGRYDASRHLSLTAEASRERIQLERSAVEEVSALALPTLYNFTKAQAGARLDYGRTRVNAVAGINQTRFRNNISTNGTPTDQSFRNYRGVGGSLLVEQSIVGQHSAYVQIDVEKRQFATPEARRRSDGYTLNIIGGLRGELTQLIRGHLGIGIIRVGFDDPAAPTLSGLTVDAQLDWLVRERTTISLTAGRELRTVAQRDARSALLTSIDLRIDEEVRRNIIASVILRRQQTDYVGDDRRASLLGATLTAEWLVDRNWSLRPQISYLRRTDRGFNLDLGPEDGQAGVSIGYRF